MKTSSSRFKSIAVSAGISFWFFIISSALGFFTIEIFAVFVASILTITIIFSSKLARGLDAFAIVNTKIFLGVYFAIFISLYGILFKLLRIDLLRLKKTKDSYWLEIDETEQEGIFKQF